MTDQDTMKLALDALEYWDVHGRLHQPTEEAITALKKRLAQETALQSLHAENKRLGLYEDAYAQPEPDELNIAYMSGLYDGKKKRPWVGLTLEQYIAINSSCTTVDQAVGSTERQLKENNT